MMISPEGYYEYHLKDKDAAQIMTVIRGLKREINRLRQVLDDPGYPYRLDRIDPDESVQLWCTRLYLERAKQALADAGGTYVPTKAEEKTIAFEKDLDTIQKLTLNIGGFFSGHTIRTYTIDGESVCLHVDHSLSYTPPGTEEVECLLTKKELVDGLRELHLNEWRKEYIDPCVMDGTQWELEICFSTGRRPLRIGGSNAYPYNFDNLLQLLEIEEDQQEECLDEDE